MLVIQLFCILLRSMSGSVARCVSSTGSREWRPWCTLWIELTQTPLSSRTSPWAARSGQKPLQNHEWTMWANLSGWEIPERQQSACMCQIVIFGKLPVWISNLSHAGWNKRFGIKVFLYGIYVRTSDRQGLKQLADSQRTTTVMLYVMFIAVYLYSIFNHSRRTNGFTGL